MCMIYQSGNSGKTELSCAELSFSRKVDPISGYKLLLRVQCTFLFHSLDWARGELTHLLPTGCYKLRQKVRALSAVYSWAWLSIPTIIEADSLCQSNFFFFANWKYTFDYSHSEIRALLNRQYVSCSKVEAHAHSCDNAAFCILEESC